MKMFSDTMSVQQLKHFEGLELSIRQFIRILAYIKYTNCRCTVVLPIIKYVF